MNSDIDPEVRMPDNTVPAKSTTPLVTRLEQGAVLLRDRDGREVRWTAAELREAFELLAYVMNEQFARGPLAPTSVPANRVVTDETNQEGGARDWSRVSTGFEPEMPDGIAHHPS